MMINDKSVLEKLSSSVAGLVNGPKLCSETIQMFFFIVIALFGDVCCSSFSMDFHVLIFPGIFFVYAVRIQSFWTRFGPID